MTELKIDRIGNSYAIDYTADGVELRDAQEIAKLIVDLYDRQGSMNICDEFIVSKVEFHGHFKIRE